MSVQRGQLRGTFGGWVSLSQRAATGLLTSKLHDAAIQSPPSQGSTGRTRFQTALLRGYIVVGCLLCYIMYGFGNIINIATAHSGHTDTTVHSAVDVMRIAECCDLLLGEPRVGKHADLFRDVIPRSATL